MKASAIRLSTADRRQALATARAVAKRNGLRLVLEPPLAPSAQPRLAAAQDPAPRFPGRTIAVNFDTDYSG